MPSKSTTSSKRLKAINAATNGTVVPFPAVSPQAAQWANVSCMYRPEINTIFDLTTPKALQEPSMVPPQVIPVTVTPPSQPLRPSTVPHAVRGRGNKPNTKQPRVIVRARKKMYIHEPMGNKTKTALNEQRRLLKFHFSDEGIRELLPRSQTTNAAGKVKCSRPATEDRHAPKRDVRPATTRFFSGSVSGGGCVPPRPPPTTTSRRKRTAGPHPHRASTPPPILPGAPAVPSITPTDADAALLASPGAMDRSLTPFITKGGFGQELQALLSSGGAQHPPPPPLLNPSLFDESKLQLDQFEPKPLRTYLSPIASAASAANVPPAAEARAHSAPAAPSDAEMLLPEGITKSEMEFALSIPMFLGGDDITSDGGDALEMAAVAILSPDDGSLVESGTEDSLPTEANGDDNDGLPLSADVPDLVETSSAAAIKDDDDKLRSGDYSSQSTCPSPARATKKGTNLPALPQCTKKHSRSPKNLGLFSPILPKAAEPDPFPPAAATTAHNATLMPSPIFRQQRSVRGRGETAAAAGVVSGASFVDRGRIPGNIAKQALGAAGVASPASAALSSMLETASYAAMLQQSCAANGGGLVAGALPPMCLLPENRPPPPAVGDTLSPIHEVPGLTDEEGQKGWRRRCERLRHLAGVAFCQP